MVVVHSTVSRRASVRAISTAAPRVVRTLLASCLSACVLTTGALAATVEFRLGPDLKGREQRIANQLAKELGAGPAVAGRQGMFTISAADDAKAAAMATALRERASVLWAQPAVSEGQIERTTPETAYHSRVMALVLNDASSAAATVARLAARTGQALTLKRVSNGNRALVVLPSGTTAAALAAVTVAATGDGNVRSAERVRLVQHQWLPNDTMWAQQWSLGTGVGGIRAAQAWDLTPSGSVAVAVIDTGIRSHPDLDAKLMSGYDMISDAFIGNDGHGRDPDATDPGDYDDDLSCSGGWDFMSSWHGTHVAGIIAASTNNGQGIAGVAPNARIVPVRALGRCGGTSDDVADAIRWAAGVPVAGVPANPNPVKVMNLSLGGYGPCSANEQAAIDAALARGTTVVVAAGNSATLASDFSPANCRGVLAVGATNLLGDISSYSNFGAAVGISAPGGDRGDLPGILSTLNGGITQPAVPSYATYMGTSMAAPHVAGVVALMLTRDPTLTPGQVINRLKAGARAFPATTDCAGAPGACGAGLLDAANAVAAVTETRAPADQSASTERARLVEVNDALTGRYALIADPVELAQMLAGQRGGAWSRTGLAVDTFSFTAQYNGLAIAQPVCRARLVAGGGYAYSASVEQCQAYAGNAGWAVDGMAFAAALPTGWLCPGGSVPVHEYVRQDALGYNTRNMPWNATEGQRMIDAGWTPTRVAFCVPQ
ncbi:MAG: S8 family peptidase [Burkholderiales bacterium]|nr:S8 family peptidase [Burkholderiales bacterium]